MSRARVLRRMHAQKQAAAKPAPKAKPAAPKKAAAKPEKKAPAKKKVSTPVQTIKLTKRQKVIQASKNEPSSFVEPR